MNTLERQRDTPLEIALIAIRLGLAILFAVWALDKIIQPDHAKAVLAGFYGQNSESLADNLPVALGVAQLGIVTLFLLGMFKTVSYGAILLMHLTTTVVSMKLHLEPLANPNILFWANWPILGAAVALFLLRGRDKLLSVG